LREEAEEKVGVIQPIVVVEVAAGGRLVEVVGMRVQKKVVVVLHLLKLEAYKHMLRTVIYTKM
jgi:hypothetical protein